LNAGGAVLGADGEPNPAFAEEKDTMGGKVLAAFLRDSAS